MTYCGSHSVTCMVRSIVLLCDLRWFRSIYQWPAVVQVEKWGRGDLLWSRMFVGDLLWFRFNTGGFTVAVFMNSRYIVALIPQ